MPKPTYEELQKRIELLEKEQMLLRAALCKKNPNEPEEKKMDTEKYLCYEYEVSR